MLSAQDIRRKFLAYFQKHGHEIVHSSPLIPQGDPTLLFTNAGMVQFKKLFLGEERRDYVRATSSQKCLRVSGKHNDLENVGRTARHHTFFEMLGNFSFGDYFKEQAIGLAWTFVTEELHLPKDKLYVTVYKDDDEAFALWQKVAGLPAERIFRLGEKDNFWSMGDTGPCGPCSEIYVDQGADMACGPNCGIGSCDCDRFLEIWNLVFMQFDQPADGPRTPLPRPSIDTGMGLERIAAVCQGKRSNFDCDLFQEIIQYAASIAGVTYSFSAPDTNDVDTALRVIADHSRAAAFLVADGTLPSNEGRGYVLRRLIRRALRFGTLMGMTEPFLHKTTRKVAEIMGGDFPELARASDFVVRVVREEEERFGQTLEKGLALLESELQGLEGAGRREVPGAVSFKLYDTYGFPLDIVNDVVEKRGFTVDVAGFEALMREQKERARKAQKGSGLLGGGKETAEIFDALVKGGAHSDFVGYTELACASRVTHVLDAQGQAADMLPVDSEGYVITERTPFYGASGGQVGDVGRMECAEDWACEVIDTVKPAPNLTVHHVRVGRGFLRAGDTAQLVVTENARLSAARNHTATHLLHAALRRVLGEHVHQAGSLVTPERLRFDFSHIAAMTPAELAAVEREVNRMILADLPVGTTVMGQKEALASGAMALFGEKYGDEVRVVRVGDAACPESVELCGGTHVRRSGEVGAFYLASESGVAAGTRRIEAATGWHALEIFHKQREALQKTGALLKGQPGEVLPRVEALLAENKKLRKELEKGAQRGASGQGRDLMQDVKSVNGVKVLCADVGAVPVKALRDLMDDVRSKLPSGVACLAAHEGDKVSLVLYVSRDLHGRFTAPDIIKAVAAPVGGSGGGRPDLAQAGGTNPQGIPQAFAMLVSVLAK